MNLLIFVIENQWMNKSDNETIEVRSEKTESDYTLKSKESIDESLQMFGDTSRLIESDPN